MKERFLKQLPIISIIIFSFFIRLVSISQIPNGLTNDEVNIVMNAQSILKTGHNIPGVVTGILGKTKGDLYAGIHSELSSAYIVPFIFLFGFNLVSIKLAFVFSSVGIVLVGYLLSKKLFNKNAAIIIAALLAINPWLIFYGRSAYESIFSSFFYLLSIYIIIGQSGWRKLYSLPFLIFGFFAYFSAKTLIIPIALVASISSKIINKEKIAKPIIVLNTLIFIFVFVYGLFLTHSPAGARIKELKSNKIVSNVNKVRTESLDSPLSTFFENKYVEDLKIRMGASLGELNANYLFLNSIPEATPSLTLPDHGFMYLVDIIFVVIGFGYLFKKQNEKLMLFGGIILSTLIPNFLNLQGTTYSIRTVVLFPMLVIIAGFGIHSIFENIKSKKIKILYLFGIFILYFVSFLNFCWIYFGRLPIERSEGWFFSQRVTANYINKLQIKNTNTKIIVVTSEPKHLFYKYLFYSNRYLAKDLIEVINKNIENKNYQLDKLSILDKCPASYEKGVIYIISSSLGCNTNKFDTSVKSINDAGDKYLILNDALCNNYDKNKYPLIKKIELLNVGSLQTKDFCENYISKI